MMRGRPESQPLLDEPWALRNGRWIVLFGGAATLAVGLLAVFVLPTWNWAVGDFAGGDLQSARADLRSSGLAVAVLLGVMTAGLLAWGRVELSRREHRLAEHTQRNDRFSSAVELLGHTDLPVRLGGLYALEGVARDGHDRQAVYDVICAFARSRRPVEREVLNRPPNDRHPDPQDPRNYALIPAIENRTDDYEAALTIVARAPSSWELELDLSGTLLVGKSFTGTLSNYNLAGASLLRCDLRAVTFDECNLSQAALDECDLSAANFIKCDLFAAALDDCNLGDVTVDHCDLSRASLSNCDLSKVTFGDSEFVAAAIANCSLPGSTLQGCNLSEATLRACNLSEAILTNCNLAGAQLSDCDSGKVTFTKCHLFAAALDDCNLGAVTVDDCDLSRTTLSNCDLSGATLRASNLSEAIPANCILSRTALSDCDLSRATLSACHFREASFRACDFSEATLSNCSFHKATLADCDFATARCDAVTGERLAAVGV